MSWRNDDFSYARLSHLYRQALNVGYRPILFGEEEEQAGPYILWRHDVDLELAAAVAVAELEAREGIRSTYFLMTRSWFYNLFSWEGVETVQRLGELGHTIGLHCDLHLGREVDVDIADVEEQVAREFTLVDAAFPGVFRRVVSFHNPPNSIFRRDFRAFYSTYQPKFFSEVKYLSDSNRCWREGPLESWFDVDRAPRLSVLLHPVIWAYPGSTMPEAMSSYLERRQGKCREMLITDEIIV